MNAKEEAKLRNVYQQWTTEQLSRAATQEKDQYQPEAIALMMEEISRRGVSPDELAKISQSLPPSVAPKGERQSTRMLPVSLNRTQYLVRWLIWAVALVVVGELLFLLPHLQALGSLWVVAALVYRVVGLDIPRMRNAGWSPWLLLLLLVPMVNIGLMFILFVIPPKK